jgi:uncharacterized protein DUF4145
MSIELTVNTAGQPAFKALCDHCSNETHQTIISQMVGVFDHKQMAYIFTKCSICDGVVIREAEGDFGHGMGELVSKMTQIWPATTLLPADAPERIQKIYLEAHSVKKKSPSSFVVQLRRAFEALAKDKKATGNNLNRQIQSLIDQEQLPGLFAEMMHITRIIGNAGAHDSEQDITTKEVEVADKFLRAVIEYLYVAPALLARAKAAQNTIEPPDEKAADTE